MGSAQPRYNKNVHITGVESLKIKKSDVFSVKVELDRLNELFECIGVQNDLINLIKPNIYK